MKFLLPYTKKAKQNSKNGKLVFFIKHVNSCKKEQGMSEDGHSESEFYYPEEGNLNVSLQNEKLEASEVFEASKVLNNNVYKKFQNAI